MSSPFPVLDVSSWELVVEETSGSDPDKEWLTAPGQTSPEILWLFKPVVEKDGRRQGEDWAEKIASELAALLGVPAARIEMATRSRRAGCLSLGFLPEETWERQPGAVLLTTVVPDFVPRARDRRGHNLANIERLLRGKQPPPGMDLPATFDAFDVFAGYLTFDAWIGNRDRHEENWSVLRDPGGTVWLAPSYDHATSLGFNLTDVRRLGILAGQPGMEHFCRKGTVHRFEDGHNQPLVDLAWSALNCTEATVREYWLSHLAAVDTDDCAETIVRTPQMSEDARTFALELLDVNRRRMLDGRN